MKQRNIIAVICFSIITLGIYDLFWLVSTKKELNARTKERIPSIWLLFIPVLVLLAVIILDGVLTASQSTSGGGNSVVGVIMAIIMGIVIIIAAIIMPVYWFLKYSKAVHDYTNGELSTAVTFILLWMLRFIGIAVIQDKFNDMVAAGNMGGAGAMPMNGAATSIAPQMPGAMPPTSVAAPINPPVAPTTPDQAQQVPPQAPQQTPVQPPMPQQSVDPTRPESYDQQSQTPPSPQPPVPPAGPVVQ